jgi:hypothetical protein
MWLQPFPCALFTKKIRGICIYNSLLHRKMPQNPALAKRQHTAHRITRDKERGRGTGPRREKK